MRSFYQRFALDLCNERSWAPPPKLSQVVCFKLPAAAADESRVSVRLMVEGTSAAASDEGKALRDWLPKGAKFKFEAKGKKPICVGISCPSNKLWFNMACEVDDINFSLDDTRRSKTSKLGTLNRRKLSRLVRFWV